MSLQGYKRFVLGLTYVWLVIAWCVVPDASVSDPAKNNKDTVRMSVLVATGMPGGTSYHVGLGMASLWTTKLRDSGIRVSAAISEGAIENIEAIRIADADLILSDDLFCNMAYEGKGIYKGRPVTELRGITNLWADTVQILVRSDKIKSGSLNDLEGLALATGLADSGNRYTTEMLLATVPGLRDKVKIRSMSHLAAAEALRNGLVQAADLTGGIPVPLVTNLLHDAKLKLGFIEISPNEAAQVKSDGWTTAFPTVIQAGTYPGQDKPIQTVAQTTVLATTSSLDPDVVYSLTKTIYENLDYLARVHPACRSINIGRAFEGMGLPLHRGAIKFYRERKIQIPDHLLP
jgi:uncharacterized protein